MELTLNARQEQRLSTQAMLSLGILQMGAQELQEYLERAVLENPTLEFPEPGTQWDRPTYAASQPEPAGERVDEVSLRQELRSQIHFSSLPPEIARETAWIIDALDRDGYLRLPETAGAPNAAQRSALALVQSLEPAGVGARSLAECLLIQLRRAGGDALAETIVREHLEDMARSHYHRIAQATGAGRDAVERACSAIRALDPRPGAAYDSAAADHVRADVHVIPGPDGPHAELSEHSVPRLLLRSDYAALRRRTDDAEVAAYLDDQLVRARVLVDALAQRRGTMQRCAALLVERQSEFFLRGPAGLRPFTMAEAADALGVHESTVSRLVKNKFLQCVWGVYPLSHFFSRAVGAPEEKTTAEAAKAQLRELIACEDGDKPYSDEALSALLRARGISISRRTAAKYRQSLGIPSAPGRRVLKKT